jgi:hypothetical protein
VDDDDSIIDVSELLQELEASYDFKQQDEES